MSKVLVTESNLQNIANAIRTKNGSSDTYTPSEMSTAIENIPSGGGSMEIVDEMKMIDLGVTLHGAYYRPWSDKDYTQSEVDKVQALMNKIGGNT